MLDARDPRLQIILRGASVFQEPTQMTRVDGGRSTCATSVQRSTEEYRGSPRVGV